MFIHVSLKKLANNDCSLRVVCGLLDLPVFSTDSVGNACGIDSSSVTISSVSETAGHNYYNYFMSLT